MGRIARLNQFPLADKFEVYNLLVPKSLFGTFNIDPSTGRNQEGEQCVFLEALAGSAEAGIRLMRDPGDADPVFIVEIGDSRDLIKLRWDFIMVNDPTAQRYGVDMTPEGGDRWLNWSRRNHKEEKRALKAGLAPGQVRKGLGLSGEFMKCLDGFCESVGFKSIGLEALFYHNALHYEKHGFRYFNDEPVMKRIDEAFQPGGALFEKLEGSTYRQGCFACSSRGRSWAIHTGILEEVWERGFDPWTPPQMYRLVGRKFEVDTAPGVSY